MCVCVGARAPRGLLQILKMDGDAAFAGARLHQPLAELKDGMAVEQSKRAAADSALMDETLRVMTRVQQEALLNFGAERA